MDPLPSPAPGEPAAPTRHPPGLMPTLALLFTPAILVAILTSFADQEIPVLAALAILGIGTPVASIISGVRFSRMFAGGELASGWVTAGCIVAALVVGMTASFGGCMVGIYGGGL